MNAKTPDSPDVRLCFITPDGKQTAPMIWFAVPEVGQQVQLGVGMPIYLVQRIRHLFDDGERQSPAHDIQVLLRFARDSDGDLEPWPRGGVQ